MCFIYFVRAMFRLSILTVNFWIIPRERNISNTPKRTYALNGTGSSSTRATGSWSEAWRPLEWGGDSYWSDTWKPLEWRVTVTGVRRDLQGHRSSQVQRICRSWRKTGFSVLRIEWHGLYEHHKWCILVCHCSIYSSNYKWLYHETGFLFY